MQDASSSRCAGNADIALVHKKGELYGECLIYRRANITLTPRRSQKDAQHFVYGRMSPLKSSDCCGGFVPKVAPWAFVFVTGVFIEFGAIAWTLNQKERRVRSMKGKLNGKVRPGLNTSSAFSPVRLLLSGSKYYRARVMSD
jgi:hypothetical protein